MRISLIPRNNYEVYFIPRTSKRPGKREILDYLHANHPCFSKDCLIDRKNRTICGKSYDMITLIDNKKYALLQYWTTTAAIFTASSLAKTKCSIQYPGETLYIDDNPRSIVESMNTKTYEVSYQFNTDKSISEFVKKEKIHARLFFPWRLIFKLIITATCTVASIFLFQQFETIIEKNNNQTSKPMVVETPMFTSESKFDDTCIFWNFFTRELQAIETAGSKISNYQYNGNLKPSTAICLEGGSPSAIQEQCKTISSNGNVTIPSISYAGKTLKYTASFEIKTKKPDIQNEPQSLDEIENFQAKCKQKNYKITSIQTIPETTYMILLQSRQLSNFLPDLEKYCSSRQLDINALQISTNSNSGEFTIALQLIARTVPYRDALYISNPEIINTVFGIVNNPATIPIRQSDEILIGKIDENGTNSIMFKKTISGKTYSQRGIIK